MEAATGQRVVVVTGASGGIGRACARAFAGRGDSVALLARGDSGLEGVRADVERAGGTALALQADVADPEQVEDAASAVEEKLGHIDVWVNVAFTSVFARFMDIEPEEFRRVTDVSYHGFVNGTRAALRPDAAPRPRHDRARRLCAGLSGHPAAERVLRLQACHPGLPRVGPYRAAARPQQGAGDHGADAGGEHAPVLVGAVPAPRPGAAGRAHLPARGGRARRLYAADHPSSPGVLGRRKHRRHVGRQRGRPRAAGPLPGTDRVHGPADRQPRRIPDQPENLWSPADGDRGHDFGAHGIFDDQSTSRSLQLWASQHHGLLGLSAVAALVGTVLARCRTRRH